MKVLRNTFKTETNAKQRKTREKELRMLIKMKNAFCDYSIGS